MSVLVTGGAGYIGTHALIELLATDHEVVIVDNISNANDIALERVKSISGKALTFYHGDVRDTELLDSIFEKHDIDSVIHFAGLKAVGESVAKPLKYYDNNVSGTVILCEAMAKANVKNLVFSSSATVNGDPASLPLTKAFLEERPTLMANLS